MVPTTFRRRQASLDGRKQDCTFTFHKVLSVDPRNQRFNTMYDYVNMDERWFWMTKVNVNLYLVTGEIPPKNVQT